MTAVNRRALHWPAIRFAVLDNKQINQRNSQEMTDVRSYQALAALALVDPPLARFVRVVRLLVFALALVRLLAALRTALVTERTSGIGGVAVARQLRASHHAVLARARDARAFVRSPRLPALVDSIGRCASC